MSQQKSAVCPFCRDSKIQYVIPYKGSPASQNSVRSLAQTLCHSLRRFYSIWTTVLVVWVLALVFITDFQCYSKQSAVQSSFNVSTEGVTHSVSSYTVFDRGDDEGLPKVAVVVYYEPLCPDSKNFIRAQLAPTMDRIGDRIDLTLVPYGKASTQESGGTYSFQCQHGPTECMGNKVHSCVVKHVQDTLLQTKIVSCMIADNYKPKKVARKCVPKYLGPNSLGPIQQCMSSIEGDQLLKHMGDLTHALNPPLTFVPTVTLDGSRDNMFQVLGNLLSAVCKKMQAPLPEQCTS